MKDILQRCLNYIDKTSEILCIIQTRDMQSESFIKIVLDTSKARCYNHLVKRAMSVITTYFSLGGVLPPKTEIYCKM